MKAGEAFRRHDEPDWTVPSPSGPYPVAVVVAQDYLKQAFHRDMDTLHTLPTFSGAVAKLPNIKDALRVD